MRRESRRLVINISWYGASLRPLRDVRASSLWLAGWLKSTAKLESNNTDLAEHVLASDVPVGLQKLVNSAAPSTSMDVLWALNCCRLTNPFVTTSSYCTIIHVQAAHGSNHQWMYGRPTSFPVDKTSSALMQCSMAYRSLGQLHTSLRYFYSRPLLFHSLAK